MTTLLHPPSGPAPMSFDVPRRRSSAVSTASSHSTRRASVVSLNLMSHSRQPLAPLGPQITPACAFADAPSIHDSSPDAKPRSRQSFSDDSLPDYSNPLDITKLHSRKASGTREGRVISTPARLQAAHSTRRGSLPILSIPNQIIPLPNSAPSPSVPLKPPADSRLFNQLQSYVLNSSRRPSKEDKHRLRNPLSPRASVSSRRGLRPEGEETRKETRDSSDDEEIARQLERAKLRAIDDGSRRPSLPINIPPSQSSVSVDRKNEIAATLAAAPKVLPEVPSSDPGPSNGLANFDLEFIFGERAYPNGPLMMPPDSCTYAGVRRLSVSLDTGTNVHGWTDTFERFVSQNDNAYSERRSHWTFQRRPDQKQPRGSAGLAPGIWECGNHTTYWVGESDDSNHADHAQESPSAPRPKKTSLVVRRFPDVDGSPLKPGSPSTPTKPFSSEVRIHIHKHSRAPAYSLFLGAWNPSRAAKSSILLATKKVHLHVSAKKEKESAASNDASPLRPRGRTVSQAVKTTLTSSPQHESPVGQDVLMSDPTKSEGNSSDEFRLPHRAPPPGYIPPYVNRDLIHQDPKVDTGHEALRATFTPLAPQARKALFEQIRSRHTFGRRIKRVLGAGDPSPPALSLASSSHSGNVPKPADSPSTYTPPWMLLAPGYLKEENDRKIKRLQTSFENAGFFPQPRTKSTSKRDKDKARMVESSRSRYFSSRSSSADHGHPRAVTSPVHMPVTDEPPSPPCWNGILDAIGIDTMCMVVPLWEFRDCHDLDASEPTPPSHERKWLLVTYVPFEKGNTIPSSPAIYSPIGAFFGQRGGSKKRVRRGSGMHFSQNLFPLSPGSVTRPAVSEDSGDSLRSFRVVGRILSNDELEHSGLRYPRIPDAAHSPMCMDVDSGNPSSSPDKHKDATSFTVVLAMCHESGSGRGIEFLPEGLDCLGLCGSAPRRVIGAITPYGIDRECGEVSSLGREIMEIAWAGCLALMDE